MPNQVASCAGENGANVCEVPVLQETLWLFWEERMRDRPEEFPEERRHVQVTDSLPSRAESSVA